MLFKNRNQRAGSVRRTRRVRTHLSWLQNSLVHSHQNGITGYASGSGVVLDRGRNHYALSASGKVGLGFFVTRKNTRRLHHHVNTVLTPRQVCRIAFLAKANGTSVNGKLVLAYRHVKTT